MIHPRSPLPRLSRIAPAVGLALLLAGCFTSSQPKFPLSTAVAALGKGGRYVTYERRDDGSFKRDVTIEVRPRGDSAYDYIDEKGKVTPVSFHRIKENIYVAQATRPNGGHSDYLMLRVEGNAVMFFPTSCDKQDAAKLTARGVVIDKRECKIDGVADPAGLFASLDPGQPGSKMVRE